MTDKPRWIENATSYEIDLGYVVLPNGDILTSDGSPRCVDELQLKMVQEMAGKPLEFRFRAPTEAERADYEAAVSPPGGFRTR